MGVIHWQKDLGYQFLLPEGFRSFPGLHLPSHGRSPTIRYLPEILILQTWNLASGLKSQNHDQLPKDGQLSALGWSPIIYNMVTHLPKDCHPASKEWSPRISSMITHHPKLFKSYKTLRNSNETWSFTLAQPSLSSFFLSFCNQISWLLIAFWQCVGTPIIHYLVTSNTRAWLNNATLITFRLAKQCHNHMIMFFERRKQPQNWWQTQKISCPQNWRGSQKWKLPQKWRQPKKLRQPEISNMSSHFDRQTTADIKLEMLSGIQTRNRI